MKTLVLDVTSVLIYSVLMRTIDLNECSKQAENCPIVEILFEQDSFEEQISELDEGSRERRELLGNFVTACVNGNCPGQDPDLARHIIERRNQA